MDWEEALWELSTGSYRRRKNGRYEAYCSDRGDYMYLGTHDTVNEAENAVFEYRAERLLSRLDEYGLNPFGGVIFMDEYMAFPNGMIFNLHGEPIRGGVNRDGYVIGILGRKYVQFHRVIASIFCERELGKDFVNHIDGDKTNNNASNLEWVTRSENALHSFRTGLQKTVSGYPIYSEDEKRYMREHCFDNYREVAAQLNRSPETVRKYMSRYRKETNNAEDF